ncbi:sensor histidine kinase [Vagococcus intermedius]|uniref:histidine kinase n=1 Tax=Vagococcus intermedius TaxID=2991418 RepID=A0AAF0CWR9_9ENTE|nr:sensor histidine kinase [Vagococcus intermedius]WEG74303.1 sensor histidine kinase [Vagococcus intermedius]WEG76385.1 sensor histidine kinase [Vagococcus intermedius]
MINLFIMMMERVGLIILLAFLLVNVNYFKKVLLSRNELNSRLQLIGVFGLFAVISNLTGIEITDNEVISTSFLTVLSADASVANTRTLAIGVSGLTGGPLVGLGVGLIGGLHRSIQGGTSGSFYIISSVLVGYLSGLVGAKFSKKASFPSPFEAAGVGALMEATQMLFVLLFTGNGIEEGWRLVQFISFPMILLNSIGTFIFLSIITTTLQREEQTKAVQTHDVLELAAKTLPYFRAGLNEASCREVAVIIKRYTKVAAISMTDTHQILAHVGAGSDHHIPELEVITELSKEVLKTGKLKIARSQKEIGCNNPSCSLRAAIVIPLMSHDKMAGTLKMYFTDANKLTHVEEQLAEGLGNIFSSQLELGEAEQQSSLLKDAEIKSLQAQVNPHFFFNAINTISALMRLDVDKARELLIQLSTYFRSNLQGARHVVITLEKELEHVAAYLSLEQARFPDKYEVELVMVEPLEEAMLPPFALQILVENAIKHAFGSRKTANKIIMSVSTQLDMLVIQVADNGQGISEELLAKVGKESVISKKGTGTALENLNRRILNLYGSKGSLIFKNNSSGGATITIKIPLSFDEGVR